MSEHKAYRQYKQLNLPEIEKEMLQQWKAEQAFEKSVVQREGQEHFVFYEGPPSANGMPGIHHVISRAIKDIFCRYKTLKGYKVERKAGWDTHGLPIELQVEKSLGITKDDIGKKISVEEYNAACRRDVLKFKDKWDELTEKIGYWVDLDQPYVTYETDYIESVWNLLQRIYDKGLLYKGYTVQPYSPAAGTGLSSHELNQPGTYKMVKDTTVIAQFELEQSSDRFSYEWGKTYALAWTTTPWTLPSNTALGIGPKIDYVAVKTFNQYTHEQIVVLLAKALVGKYFPEKNQELELNDYEKGDKAIPYEVIEEFKGSELAGLSYHQLMPYQQPEGKAFEIIAADFVTTEDGTGIVHLAPSFGADDFRAAQRHGIDALTLVDKQGKFIQGMGDLSGKYVKNYTGADESAEDYMPTDVYIAIKLKTENKAFKVEKYEHSYPHCWRTDKPILYYPMESWFIKTTAVKDQLIALNKTINWKPASTGEGRFGNWLENLVDWNLSRSRYWGTPLPIWRSEDGTEEKCIGSVAQLKQEVDKAVELGFMDSNPVNESFDLHRPFIDQIVLASDKGTKLKRESDLIDVWFDSGAMPYAQWHYPFENKEAVNSEQVYPADFIAEGVDQTRGWFFTLHAISVMLNDKIAYKNVIANGLVLDKKGNKMSKRLGNTIDPFEAVNKYSADALRWYMISNASPWDNLKFDLEGVTETQRKFFGTLYNTYAFFSLYANIDEFDHRDETVPLAERTELDQWIISKLHSLIKTAEQEMDNYEPTRAARAIQSFVIDDLSNWYVRLNRRRFWKGQKSRDKWAAYQSLHECLLTVSQLMSSISPFFSDRLYRDLAKDEHSVHWSDFPACDEGLINSELEQQIEISQRVTSLILRIRKLENIKVRQPLQKALVPALDNDFSARLKNVEGLIKSEVNIKELQILEENSKLIKKSAKPNFKVLGPKVGADMKVLNPLIQNLNSEQVNLLESGESISLEGSQQTHSISLEDVEIQTAEIPGWQIMSDGQYTVALDLQIDDNLRIEGVAREMVNRIQNLRKEKDFEVTDQITVEIDTHSDTNEAVSAFNQYICGEILANSLVVRTDHRFEDQIVINDQTIGINLIK